MYTLHLVPGKLVGSDLVIRVESNSGITEVWNRDTNTWVKIKDGI